MIPAGRRAPVKARRILNELRRQIVEGRFPPGSQLPKREDLEAHFHVSPLTLQKALSRLISDGFVYAKTGQGTFVVDEPPHLSRYGLVFPSDPGMPESWNNFYTALNNEALGIQRAKPGRLTMYYGLEHPAKHEIRDELIADVEAHRLAGLIFASPPFNFAGTPLLDAPGMARASGAPYRDLPSVRLDSDSMMDKTMRYLTSRGRRRIALLSGHVKEPSFPDFAMAIAAAHLETRPFWQQAVHPNYPHWAKHVVELLFQPGNAERPDGLIIADDNIVPHATAGLVAAGVSVPDEVDVVAHCNFPWPTPSAVPAKRIGYDARHVLHAFINLIDMQRRGEVPPTVTEIAAVTDDEVDSRICELRPV